MTDSAALSGAPTGTALVTAAVIVALVQYLVKPFTADPRWYPVAALAFVLLGNLAVAYATHGDLLRGAGQGLLSGLAAAGGYSGVQTFKREAERGAEREAQHEPEGEAPGAG